MMTLEERFGINKVITSLTQLKQFILVESPKMTGFSFFFPKIMAALIVCHYVYLNVRRFRLNMSKHFILSKLQM